MGVVMSGIKATPMKLLQPFFQWKLLQPFFQWVAREGFGIYAECWNILWIICIQLYICPFRANLEGFLEPESCVHLLSAITDSIILFPNSLFASPRLWWFFQSLRIRRHVSGDARAQRRFLFCFPGQVPYSPLEWDFSKLLFPLFRIQDIL